MSTSDDTYRLLYEVAVATSGVLEPERLAQLAVERSRQLTGADSTLLFWWVPERELLVLMACDPPGSAPHGCTRGRGGGHCVRHRQPAGDRGLQDLAGRAAVGGRSRHWGRHGGAAVRGRTRR